MISTNIRNAYQLAQRYDRLQKYESQQLIEAIRESWPADCDTVLLDVAIAGLEKHLLFEIQRLLRHALVDAENQLKDVNAKQRP